MPRNLSLRFSPFKRVYPVYCNFKILSADGVLEEKTDLGVCEEEVYLDQCLGETEKIQMELQSTMNYLKKLSVKYSSKSDIIFTLPPGNIWSQLTCNEILMINEQRQKHDLNLPQQHHKVQEINDGSSSSISSAESNIKIINHLSESEVNEESKFNVDECFGGDKESLNQETESNHQANCVPPTFEYLRRHRFRVEFIKIKHEIQSIVSEVRKAENRMEHRVCQTNNYFFKKEPFGTPTPKKCTKSHRHSSSPSSFYSGSPRSNIKFSARKSSTCFASKTKISFSEF